MAREKVEALVEGGKAAAPPLVLLWSDEST